MIRGCAFRLSLWLTGGGFEGHGHGPGILMGLLGPWRWEELSGLG